MKFLKPLILSLLATLAGATGAHALPAVCVPQAEMQEIATSFPQFQNYATKDYCFDESRDAHLIAGIVFMRKTQFRGPLDHSTDELFSGTFSSNWWNYFIGRINQFEISDSCPKGVVAYVYSFGGKTMYVCSGALTNQYTGLDLASVFMHEARHIDGFPHITCSHGPRQGLQGACDSKISDTGSYAVTVETYSQLAKYAFDIHPALRAYARSASLIYADEAFETPARINRADRFLVLSNDLRITALNLDKTTQSLGLVPELGHIVMRAQHMILFPDNTANNARYLFVRSEGEIGSSAGNQADEYNALSPTDRASMVDVHISAQWNARVYKTKVRFDCDPRAVSTQELPLADSPVGLLYPNGYDRAAKQTQLMTESGKVYDLGCNGKQAFLRVSATTFDQKYQRIYKVGNLELGLTPDGFLREITGASSKPYSLGKLDGTIRQLVPNQAVDFYSER